MPGSEHIADPHSRAGHGSPLSRRLRLQQFAIFIKVIEAGSVLAASRELAMTQPAISKSIQDLEAQVGTRLFERGKTGMRVTESGMVFESHARLILSQLRYLSEDLDAMKTGMSGHLIVGTLIAASATLLPNAIGNLRSFAPDVDVTVKVGSNSTLHPQLIKGEVDIVLGILPEELAVASKHHHDISLLKHVPLFDEGFDVVISAKHPLAAQERIGMHELGAMGWIIPTRESANYLAAQQFFHSNGQKMPQRVIESVSILTNLELVIQWGMVAMMPKSAARRFERLGLVKALEYARIERITRVGYTIRADRENSAILQNFIGALHQSLREGGGG